MRSLAVSVVAIQLLLCFAQSAAREIRSPLSSPHVLSVDTGVGIVVPDSCSPEGQPCLPGCCAGLQCAHPGPGGQALCCGGVLPCTPRATEGDARGPAMASAATQAAAPARRVTWWYSPTNYFANDAAAVLAKLKQHRNAVTNVVLDCGHYVGAGGVVTLNQKFKGVCTEGDHDGNGNSVIANLTKEGIDVEIGISAGSCAISLYHDLFSNNATLDALLGLKKTMGPISGVSFDLEPQPISAPTDAVLYAKFLSGLKPHLNAAGMRLTAWVAAWSPMLSNYTVLGTAVDKLFDMETYNANSMSGWLNGDAYGGYYTPFVKGAGAAAAPAMGIWTWAKCPEKSKTPCWSTTSASGPPRMAQLVKDGVTEVALFQITQEKGAPFAPAEWWWPLLASYLAGNDTMPDAPQDAVQAQVGGLPPKCWFTAQCDQHNGLCPNDVVCQFVPQLGYKSCVCG